MEQAQAHFYSSLKDWWPYDPITRTSQISSLLESVHVSINGLISVRMSFNSTLNLALILIVSL